MLKEKLKVGRTSIRGQDGEAAFLFVSGMAIDADGSPHAYNPSDTGLDNLANAGRPGNWWGLVTDNDKPTGRPVVQSSSDPAPGYYVSSTSLADPAFTRVQQRRYVNSEVIPFFVLPSAVLTATGIRLGDFALVKNSRTGKQSFAIFADGGPAGKIGEGSIALAIALGVPSSPKHGGTSLAEITFLAFPGSGTRSPVSAADVQAKGAAAFARFGGTTRLKEWLSAIPKPIRSAGVTDLRPLGPTD